MTWSSWDDRPPTRRPSRLRSTAARELARWLGARGILYAKTDITGPTWLDKANRGIPPFLVHGPPPGAGSPAGVAVYLRVGESAQLTDSQRDWIEHLEANGWVVTIAFGADDAIRSLEEIGYGRQT